jgi:hypothetical protein
VNCELCGCPLLPENVSGWCRECSLIVSQRLDILIDERWGDLDGQYVVSERGRVAKLLKVDRSNRYPRVSVGGDMRYVHALVAEAWHGPRPDGLLVLHHDTIPRTPPRTTFGTATTWRTLPTGSATRLPGRRPHDPLQEISACQAATRRPGADRRAAKGETRTAPSDSTGTGHEGQAMTAVVTLLALLAAALITGWWITRRVR